MKYTRTNPEYDPKEVYEAEQVKEYTKIMTRWGEATIAPDNWIITINDETFGLTDEEFKLQFKKVAK